jgi:O-antigen/teichoic acid export membrane protein
VLVKYIFNFSPLMLFGAVLRPFIYRIPKDDIDTTRTTFSLVAKFNIYIVMVPALSLAVFYEDIIHFFLPGKFEGGSSIIGVYLLFSLLTSCQQLVGNFIQLYERVGILLISRILIIIKILFIFLLVPQYGVLGLIVAVGLSDLMKLFFLWYFVRNNCGFFSYYRFFFAVGLLVGIPLFFIKYVFLRGDWYSYVFTFISFFVVLFAYWRFAPFTLIEKHKLNNLIGKNILYTGAVK